MHRRDTTGKWGEALAMAWLVDRGYEVFVGFGNTSCDLMALKDGITFRVEVKAMRGTYRHVNIPDPSKFDMLLVVTDDGVVLDPPRSMCVGAPTLESRLS